MLWSRLCVFWLILCLSLAMERLAYFKYLGYNSGSMSFSRLVKVLKMVLVGSWVELSLLRNCS